MPAIPLDAALLHVTEADSQGNCVILSPDPFFDELFARAATACYLSCERLVPTAEICGRERARYHPFERNLVTGVAHVPYGAHPTASVPGYGIDVVHLREYADATGDAWAAYYSKYVQLADHATYLAAVGGAARLDAIAPPVY